MSGSALLAGRREVPDVPTEPGLLRLAVAWQHPESRSIQPVGLLSFDGQNYAFDYVRNAQDVVDFRPFLGLDRLEQHYASPRLFPLFAQRIMRTSRPDYADHVETLDLHGDASAWEVLARSEGRRAGDCLLLFPEPAVAPDGTTSVTCFVHGLRHAERTWDGVLARLATLRPGERLRLEEQRDNPYNNRALLVCEDAQPLGWVPDLLLPHVHGMRQSGHVDVVVAHVNGEDTPPPLRLLVSLNGRVEPGSRPFTGPGWRRLAPGSDG